MPDTSSGRFTVFMLLFVYHSAHTLGNTFGMAVLAQTSWVWLVAYLLADHCGLILYKLARGDLVYWVPGLGVSLSMLTRFGAKVTVDFTGCARSQIITRSAVAYRIQHGLCCAAGVFTFATRWSWAAFTSSSTR
jgi:hypothetical protein